MASLIAFDAIESYLRQKWSGDMQRVEPLVFENENFIQDGSTWIYVEIFGNLYDQESIGAETITGNLWREEGLLSLHVMMPRGQGSRLGRQVAYDLAQLFRGVELPGNLRFMTQSIGAGEPGDEDGNYNRMSLVIDWQRDE